MQHTLLRRLGALLGAVVVSIGVASPARAAAPETIVQLQPGVGVEAGRAAVEAAGGRFTRDLHLIDAVGAVVPAGAAERLAADPVVARITPAAKVRSTATTLVDTSKIGVSYNASVFAQKVWNDKGLTGKGVGVAVIDTGIAGDLPDFRVSAGDPASRVVASVVTNPSATPRTTRTVTARTSPASSPATATTGRRAIHCAASTSALRPTRTWSRSR